MYHVVPGEGRAVPVLAWYSSSNLAVLELSERIGLGEQTFARTFVAIRFCFTFGAAGSQHLLKTKDL